MKISSFIFFFFISSFLLFHGVFCANLITETCNKIAQTDPNVNYDFCVAALQKDPRSHTADLKELGLISLNLTKTNASHTYLYIKRLSNHKNLNPSYKMWLSECLELYLDSLSSLKKAMKEFQSKDYSGANIHVSAAMDSPTTCEDEFKEKKGLRNSPLTKSNKDVFELGAISLAIIVML